MRKLILILSIILIATFETSVHAQKPTPRVNNVWGQKNSWMRDFHQRAAATPAPRLPVYYPQRQQYGNGNNYYYRPIIINNYFTHPYRQRYDTRAFGNFWLQLGW